MILQRKQNTKVHKIQNRNSAKTRKIGQFHEQGRGCVVKRGALISATLELCCWRNCILKATSGHPTLLVVASTRDEPDWRAAPPITRGHGTQLIGCCTAKPEGAKTLWQAFQLPEKLQLTGTVDGRHVWWALSHPLHLYARYSTPL